MDEGDFRERAGGGVGVVGVAVMPTKPKTHRPAHYRKPDQRRGSAHERGYGARWQRERLVYLNHHPLCVVCERRGITKAATIVDHIIPHRGNDVLFWDVANWQPLCASHHSEKTAKGL